MQEIDISMCYFSDDPEFRSQRTPDVRRTNQRYICLSTAAFSLGPERQLRIRGSYQQSLVFYGDARGILEKRIWKFRRSDESF